jgi:hypothetical protein
VASFRATLHRRPKSGDARDANDATAGRSFDA